MNWKSSVDFRALWGLRASYFLIYLVNFTRVTDHRLLILMSSIWMQGHLVTSVSSRQVKLLESNHSLSLLAPLTLAQDYTECQKTSTAASQVYNKPGKMYPSQQRYFYSLSDLPEYFTQLTTPTAAKHLQRYPYRLSRCIKSGKPSTPFFAEVLPRGLQILQAERATTAWGHLLSCPLTRSSYLQV